MFLETKTQLRLSSPARMFLREHQIKKGSRDKDTAEVVKPSSYVFKKT